MCIHHTISLYFTGTCNILVLYLNIYSILLCIYIYIGTGAKAYIAVTKLYAQRKEARDRTHADLKALVVRFAQGRLVLVYNIYMTYYTPLIYTYKKQTHILH